MKTPAGRECPHFYGDYFRGRNLEECRLLKQQGQRWSPDLCKTCPVPEIARANSCQHMKLQLEIVRPFLVLFQRRVQVRAHCEKTKRDVTEPQVGCGDCHGAAASLFTFKINE